MNTRKATGKSKTVLLKMAWKANSKTMIKKRLKREKKAAPRGTTTSTAMRSPRKRWKLTCSSSKNNNRSSMAKRSTGRRSKKTAEAMSIDA